MGDTSLRRWLRAVGLGLAGLALIPFVLVVAEPVDAHPEGDAVVVHAGGHGERMERALELIDAGATPVLVIMYGDHPEFPQAPELCGSEEPVVVLCPAPDPESTVGEAREISRLAEEHGWDRVVVVTTDYHLRRAKLVDARCSDVEVLGAAATRPMSPWERITKVGHEMVGLAHAVVTGC